MVILKDLKNNVKISDYAEYACNKTDYDYSVTYPYQNKRKSVCLLITRLFGYCDVVNSYNYQPYPVFPY